MTRLWMRKVVSGQLQFSVLVCGVSCEMLTSMTRLWMRKVVSCQSQFSVLVCGSIKWSVAVVVFSPSLWSFLWDAYQHDKMVDKESGQWSVAVFSPSLGSFLWDAYQHDKMVDKESGQWSVAVFGSSLGSF